jgi:hypothetical protein
LFRFSSTVGAIYGILRHRLFSADGMLGKRIVGAAACHKQHRLLFAVNTITFACLSAKCLVVHTRWRPPRMANKSPSLQPHTCTWYQRLPHILFSHWSLPLKNQCADTVHRKKPICPSPLMEKSEKKKKTPPREINLHTDA